MTKLTSFKKTSLILTAACVTAVLMCLDCSNESDEEGKTAKANLVPTGANSPAAPSGTVQFTQVAGGVHMVGTFKGLTPGLHGFHVHEKGSCDSLGNAAGGHFNPLALDHGIPDSVNHHMGDLGNLTVGTDSSASVDRVVGYLTLEGANSIVGHALVVHALMDNGSQPLGAAGARISCAVIAEGK